SKPGTKRMIGTLSRRARGDMAAKGQRVADVADRLQAAAGAADNNCAIAKDAAEQRLVDIDALDLVAVHLDGMAGDQAGFVDDAMAGYRQFGRRPPDKCAHSPQQPQQSEYDHGNSQGQVAIMIGSVKTPTN